MRVRPRDGGHDFPGAAGAGRDRDPRPAPPSRPDAGPDRAGPVPPALDPASRFGDGRRRGGDRGAAGLRGRDGRARAELCRATPPGRRRARWTFPGTWRPGGWRLPTSTGTDRSTFTVAHGSGETGRMFGYDGSRFIGRPGKPRDRAGRDRSRGILRRSRPGRPYGFRLHQPGGPANVPQRRRGAVCADAEPLSRPALAKHPLHGGGRLRQRRATSISSSPTG